MATRKPRSDSKLDALDLDQQRQLCEWLLTPGLSYELIKKQVFEEFNVSTSAHSLSCFYQSYVAAYVIERRRQAVGLAVEVRGEMEKRPGEFSQATIDALEQKAFELAQNPMCDPRDVKAIFTLVLKARDQTLQRDKFQFDAAKAVLANLSELKAIARDRSLSEDDQIKRVQMRLWGPAPAGMESKA